MLMRNLTLIMACVLVPMLYCPSAGAYTLTFDDVPSGTALAFLPSYTHQGVNFSTYVQASNHTNSGWGIPHSAPNVAVWTGDPYSSLDSILFGSINPFGTVLYHINSVGAYFSTQTGTVIQMTAINHIDPNINNEVQSVLIGGAGESWDNHYVELGVPGSTFNMIQLTALSGASGLRGFCVDDMTVTPIPEPSSLLALLTGLAGLGAARRRRQPLG